MPYAKTILTVVAALLFAAAGPAQQPRSETAKPVVVTWLESGRVKGDVDGPLPKSVQDAVKADEKAAIDACRQALSEIRFRLDAVRVRDYGPFVEFEESRLRLRRAMMVLGLAKSPDARKIEKTVFDNTMSLLDGELLGSRPHLLAGAIQDGAAVGLDSLVALGRSDPPALDALAEQVEGLNELVQSNVLMALVLCERPNRKQILEKIIARNAGHGLAADAATDLLRLAAGKLPAEKYDKSTLCALLKSWIAAEPEIRGGGLREQHVEFGSRPGTLSKEEMAEFLKDKRDKSFDLQREALTENARRALQLIAAGQASTCVMPGYDRVRAIVYDGDQVIFVADRDYNGQWRISIESPIEVVRPKSAAAK